MDPTETLRRLRELVTSVSVEAIEDVTALESDALELAECFEALDTWITKGGFLPNAWKR